MQFQDFLPFYKTVPTAVSTLESERERKEEHARMMTYFTEYEQTLQKRIEEEADRKETQGSLFYDAYPDKETIRRMAKKIWEEWESEFPSTVREDVVYIFLVGEIFRRRNRMKRGESVKAVR